MGEFGFITADDVYHVTVYATDENGNFKVISMKNTKLLKGPAPEAFGTRSATTSTTPQPFMVKTTAKSSLAGGKGSGEPACASCSLPAKPKPETETINPLTGADGLTDAPPPFKVVSKVEKPSSATPTTSQIDALPQKIVNQNGGNSVSRFGSNGANSRNQNANNRPSTSPNQSQLNQKLNAPQFFNKNAGNAAHYNKMENQLNGLLYKFNYSTDHQGHREEGDWSGNKDGEYYSVGRDKIKQVVSYKANEFGYMPFIRQEPLDQQELQNYDEQKNRLRGNSFEWFYPK